MWYVAHRMNLILYNLKLSLYHDNYYEDFLFHILYQEPIKKKKKKKNQE